MSNGWYATYNDFGATWGKKVGAVGIAIYQSLASRAWDGQCFPSYQTIAEDTGVSRPTAIKYIKKLQQVGLIEVQPRFNRRGDPTSNLYTLTNLPLLKKAEVQTKPAFEELDTSNLSEEEIAELKRKSLFLPRTKKKAKKAQKPETISSAVVPTPEPAEQNVEVKVATIQTVVPPPAVEHVVEPSVVPQSTQIEVSAPPAQTVSNSTPPPRNEQQIILGDFGNMCSEKELIKAYHLLKGVPSTLRQAVIDELNKAIRENRIQTTPIQYLAGLAKKAEQGKFVPSANNKKTEEDEFREQQQRAMEKEKERKKAISECPRCNSVGYLVYSPIEPYLPKSIMCTHDAKADEFIAKKKAEEEEGETICYFGKGKPLSTEESKRALEAIHNTVSIMSGRPPAPVIPTADASLPTDEEMAMPSVQADTPEAQEKPRGGGFKSIGQLANSAFAQTIAAMPASEPSQPQEVKKEQTLQQQEEKPQLQNNQPSYSLPTDTDLIIPSNGPLSELGKLIATVPEHVIPVPVAQKDLEGFGEYTEEEKQELLAQTPEPADPMLHPNGKPMSKLAQKLFIMNKQLEELYTREEITVQLQIKKHIQLQTVVRAARLRALVDKSTRFSADFTNIVWRFINAIHQAAPIMMTVPYLRRNRLILDKLLDIYESPMNGEPSQEILLQKLVDTQQEINIVKKYLEIEIAIRENNDETTASDEPGELAACRKITRHLKQYTLMCLIQDENPEVKGDLIAANELMPAQLKCTEHELKMIVYGHPLIKTTRSNTPY